MTHNVAYFHVKSNRKQEDASRSIPIHAIMEALKRVLCYFHTPLSDIYRKASGVKGGRLKDSQKEGKMAAFGKWQ